MQALIHAGGKGTRMGRCGIEKPMQCIGDKHTIDRVIDALSASRYIDRIVVSVSDNTPKTADHLRRQGVEVIVTSGESFMDDIHVALSVLDSDYVLMCPSDLPMITTEAIDSFIEFFVPGEMDSALAVVDEQTVRSIGIVPSYTRNQDDRNWVLSGVSIVDRRKTIAGEYLEETLFETNWIELSVNVNTPKELDLARSFVRE